MEKFNCPHFMDSEKLLNLMDDYGDKNLIELSKITDDTLLGDNLKTLIDNYNGNKDILALPIKEFKGLLTKVDISNPYLCTKIMKNCFCSIETFIKYFHLLNFNLGDNWMEKADEEMNYARIEIDKIINNYINKYPMRDNIDPTFGSYHVVLDELDELRTFVKLNEKSKYQYVKDIEYKIECIEFYLEFYTE